MAGIVDRARRFVVDGAPIVTGFVAIADAWACTNPSAGRGLTVGFLHALELRNTLRERLDDPRAVVEAFDARTESQLRPWYDGQIVVDRARFAEMNALREGREPPRPTDELFRGIAALFSTMALDPDLFRAALEYVGTVTPVQEILARPEIQRRIAAVRATVSNAPPPSIPGPDRAQLLKLVS
jgi:2-polyprenyl-6-methoxyphenol hydroxylase-like FAD-dependent oxidoreductase